MNGDAGQSDRWARLSSRNDVARVLRLRYGYIIFAGVSAAVLAGGRGDWNYFVEIGRSIFGEGRLDVYALYPDSQTGPLTLLFAAFASLSPRNGFVLAQSLALVLGVLSIWMVDRELRLEGRRNKPTVLLGGLVTIVWWSQLAKFGHVDDALALTLVLIATLQHRRGDARSAALVVGVATLFKPWAIMFLPLAIATSRTSAWGEREPAELRSAVRNLILCACVAIAGWMPFILASPESVRSIRPTVGLAPDSVLLLLNLGGIAGTPVVRVTQLALAIGLTTAAVIRHRPEAVLAVGVAARLVLDPGTWSYYSAGLVLGAFVIDAHNRDRHVPTLTIMTALLVHPPLALVSDETARAMLRLTACCAVIVVGLSGRSTVPNTRTVAGARQRPRSKLRGL